MMSSNGSLYQNITGSSRKYFVVVTEKKSKFCTFARSLEKFDFSFQ